MTAQPRELTSRTAKNSPEPAKRLMIDKTTIALHKFAGDAVEIPTLEGLSKTVDVVDNLRSQICVGRCRTAARDHLDHVGPDARRLGNMCKAKLGGDGADTVLVVRV